jgi:RecB family exonuclease
VADAIETLRLGQVRPEDVDNQAETKQGFLPLLAETYRLYEKALAEHGLYDKADRFEAAVRDVEESNDAENAAYAVFGETDVHECGLDLLSTLREVGQAFYQIGASDTATAPETTASAVFFSEPDLETSASEALSVPSESAPEPRFQRAVWPVREVRSVLRDILRENRPLDEVEIAYTASRPYLTLLADEAERMGLPFTLGTGLPLIATRPGQALSGFYEWIESGYDAAVLIRLLRSGLLKTKGWAESKGDIPALPAHRVATVLANQRYGPGLETYEKTLTAAKRAVGDGDEIPDPDDLSDYDGRRLRRLEGTLAFIRKLVDLIPEGDDAQGLATGSLTFLPTFGPSLRRNGDEEAMVTEKSKTTAEIANSILREQLLEEAASLPVDVDGTPEQMARAFREMIESRYLGAQSASPGALHILPLDSAGFSGREHLYVVGMDSETASTPSIDEPVLSSRSREAFSKPLEGTLPNPRNAAEDEAWRFDQALKRHQGTLMLVTTVFDPHEGESRHPSTLYLQKRQQVQKNRRENAPDISTASGAENAQKHNPAEPIEGLVPSPRDSSDPDLFLDESEAWLAAFPAASRIRNGRPNGERPDQGEKSPTAREKLHSSYPWIQDGEKARLARASETYTVYDGFLATEAPELDFLDPDYEGPPISAGRLQMLAESPYAYFLKYVLRVEPREELALDEEPWLNPRRKGNILHRSFNQFMSNREEAPLHETEQEELLSVVEDIAEEESKRVHPGTDAALASALRELKTCARLFFQTELKHSERNAPVLHEWGFGYQGRRREEEDIGDVELDLRGSALPVRGRIDRVDRKPDGTLAVWDYKTGSQSSFSREEPLKHGAKIQWALYALVLEQHGSKLEQLSGEATVSGSGYFFTSEKEMGTRLSFPMTDENRQDTVDTIEQLASLARTGSFPIAPKEHKNRPWRFGDWDAVHRDLEERVDVLDKESPFAEGLDGKVHPHFLEPDE